MSETAKAKKHRCFNCGHAGKGFKAFSVTSHHCMHPDKDVRDIPPQDTGWGTLREWYDSCAHWKKRIVAAVRRES